MNHIIKHNKLNFNAALIQTEHMDKISEMIAEYSGIQINRLLAKHVIREIAKQMQLHSADDPDDYISILKTKDGYTYVMDNLISAISVSESYFFRNKGQFCYIYNEFFPQFYERKGSCKKNIKIWSVGCSRGEEPYSVAIIAEKFFKSYPYASFDIWAGDISNTNLKSAKKGVYSPRSVRKDFNGFNAILGKIEGEHDDKGQFTISKHTASFVNFVNFNLTKRQDVKKLENSDIILCRNVLIYFDEKFVEKLINIFYESLNPGGILLLGETEILPKSFSKFLTINYENTYIFKKAL